MSGLRFSIAHLLAAVALIGVGLVALNAPNPVTAGLLTLATIGALLTAVLGVIYRTGEARAFWLGVVVFGGAYFAIAFSSALPAAELWLREPLKAVRRAFWTTSVPAGQTTLPQGKDSAYDEAAHGWLTWPAWDGGFGATAHCFANWLWALMGGAMALWFYVTSLLKVEKDPRP